MLTRKNSKRTKPNRTSPKKVQINFKKNEKFFLSLAFMLIGSLSFANYSNVKTETSKAETKEVVKPKIYNVYCNGVYSGFFSCDGCNVQAVANAICNG